MGADDGLSGKLPQGVPRAELSPHSGVPADQAAPLPAAGHRLLTDRLRAGYRFRGKQLLFLLLVATFIIPAQTTVIPQMLTYKRYGLLGNVLSLIIPAALGQGFRSAIFVLIFYQNFSRSPKC